MRMTVNPTVSARCFCLGLLLPVLLGACLATDGGGPQSGGNQGTVSGTVLDATGAVVIGATVKIHNPVSGFDGSTQTNTTGGFTFDNVPFNPYHLTVTANGFASYAQDVAVRAVVVGQA